MFRKDWPRAERVFFFFYSCAAKKHQVQFCSSAFISPLPSPTSISVPLIAFILHCFAPPHMAQPPINLLYFLPIPATGRNTMAQQKEKEKKEKNLTHPYFSLSAAIQRYRSRIACLQGATDWMKRMLASHNYFSAC